MSYKTLVQPNWWLHSAAAWIDLSKFFIQFEDAHHCLPVASNWTLIPAGESHTNYRLELPKQSFFVQVYNQKNSLLQPATDYMALYKTITTFESIQPWLVACYYESNHVKIDQWFVSDNSTNLTASNHNFIESLTSFLDCLHRYNLSEKFIMHTDEQLLVFKNSLEEFSLPKIDIEEYIERYRHLALLNNAEHSERIESLYRESKSLSQYFVADTFCHNDLGFNNILWSKDEKLKIIDWEYCGVSDRYIELANLISECNMDRSQEAELLRVYGNKSNLIIDLEKLSQMKLLSSCINQLWIIATD